MTPQTTEVAVLICCYDSRQYIEDCLNSVMASDDPDIEKHIVVVDDASEDNDSEFVSEHFPEIDCIRHESNMGFAGANNFGWKHVGEEYPDAKYITLLNVDTEVQSGWLRSMVDAIESDESIGAVQSKLRMHPETELINTAGNHSHFLGFGYLTGYREKDEGQYDSAQSIDYASGAAVMVSKKMIDQVGLFDDVFYMNLEDAELCWKIRQLCLDIRLAPASVVFHKYIPTPMRYYYELERNRWLLLFKYYRLPTLILLSPALLFMELGQCAFALFNGKLIDKFRSYLYFLRPANIARINRQRREAQKRRTVGDRQFMTRFTGAIRSPLISNPLLNYIANPILGAYWAIARRLIFW